MPKSRAEIIANVCAALSSGDVDAARGVVASEYPHVSFVPAGRNYSKIECVQVFRRDGYVDRYSGQRLVFPGSLRLLSLLLPAELPFHRNWKMQSCHLMWWELYPTVDHIVPVARGGSDEVANWVTTSMLRNGAKSNWTVEELGWQMLPPGNIDEWDGLTRWCLDQVERQPQLVRKDSALRQWIAAAKRAEA